MIDVNRDASVSVESKVEVILYLTRRLTPQETLALMKYVRKALPTRTAHIVESQHLRGAGHGTPKHSSIR